MASKKTVIVTGASQGIGAAIVQAFLDRGYNVVATSRSVSRAGFAPSPNLALVDGDIGQAATAEKVAQAAISKKTPVQRQVSPADRSLDRLVLGAMQQRVRGHGAAVRQDGGRDHIFQIVVTVMVDPVDGLLRAAATVSQKVDALHYQKVQSHTRIH